MEDENDIDIDELFSEAITLKQNAYNLITDQIAKGLLNGKPRDILSVLTALSTVIEAQNEFIQSLYLVATESR